MKNCESTKYFSKQENYLTNKKFNINILESLEMFSQLLQSENALLYIKVFLKIKYTLIIVSNFMTIKCFRYSFNKINMMLSFKLLHCSRIITLD